MTELEELVPKVRESSKIDPPPDAFGKLTFSTTRSLLMEGTNNKINTMKHQTYGYHDMEFFVLKILSIYETNYALVG